MNFDIEAARKEGYTDAEIADYLGKTQNFDVEGARKAGYNDAEILKELGVGAPEAVTPPTSSSFLDQLGRQVGLTARGAVTGLASIPTMVGDPLNYTINKLFGTNLQMPSEATQQLMTAAGLPEPQTSTERAVQAGVSALSGVGGQAAMAQKLAPELLAPLTQQLGTQAAVAGVSAPVSQQVVERSQPSLGTPLSLAAGLAAGVLAGGGAAAALKKGQPLPKTITIEDVQNKARKSYQNVKDMGLTLKPLSVKGLNEKALRDLEQYNFSPEINEAHRPIASLINNFDKMVGTERVKFGTLEKFREAANGLRTPDKDPQTRLMANRLIQSIDEYMSGLSPNDLITGKAMSKEAVSALTDARKNWKVAARAQVLQDVLDVASARALDPKASDNELIRRGLINLIKDKKRMSLFSSQEKEAMKKAASGGPRDALLSLIARFNPARSQITAAGTLAGGMAYDPVVAGATAVTGFAADKMQQAYRQKAMQNLITGMLTGNLEQPISPVGSRSLISTLQGIQQ